MAEGSTAVAAAVDESQQAHVPSAKAAGKKPAIHQPTASGSPQPPQIPTRPGLQTRQKRVLPSRSRRGGPGVGSCDVDVLILETRKRRLENEPLIPATTEFLLTTNSTLLPPPVEDPASDSDFALNSSSYGRYFDRPDVQQACREQQIIQTPEFTQFTEDAAVGGRFRPRGGEEESADTSDAAYEKRHRKYETFEKRQRLREKEKLKHEHYKLKERIEQLRAMDFTAFLALPASALSDEPSGSQVEHYYGVDTGIIDLPGAHVNGAASYNEGERRRKEMLDIATSLEERYRLLLPPDRPRPEKKDKAKGRETASTSVEPESVQSAEEFAAPSISSVSRGPGRPPKEARSASHTSKLSAGPSRASTTHAQPYSAVKSTPAKAATELAKAPPSSRKRASRKSAVPATSLVSAPPSAPPHPVHPPSGSPSSAPATTTPPSVPGYPSTVLPLDTSPTLVPPTLSGPAVPPSVPPGFHRSTFQSSHRFIHDHFPPVPEPFTIHTHKLEAPPPSAMDATFIPTSIEPPAYSPVIPVSDLPPTIATAEEETDVLMQDTLGSQPQAKVWPEPPVQMTVSEPAFEPEIELGLERARTPPTPSITTEEIVAQPPASQSPTPEPEPEVVEEEQQLSNADQAPGRISVDESGPEYAGFPELIDLISRPHPETEVVVEAEAEAEPEDIESELPPPPTAATPAFGSDDGESEVDTEKQEKEKSKQLKLRLKFPPRKTTIPDIETPIQPSPTKKPRRSAPPAPLYIPGPAPLDHLELERSVSPEIGLLTEVAEAESSAAQLSELPPVSLPSRRRRTTAPIAQAEATDTASAPPKRNRGRPTPKVQVSAAVQPVESATAPLPIPPEVPPSPAVRNRGILIRAKNGKFLSHKTRLHKEAMAAAALNHAVPDVSISAPPRKRIRKDHHADHQSASSGPSTSATVPSRSQTCLLWLAASRTTGSIRKTSRATTAFGVKVPAEVDEVRDFELPWWIHDSDPDETEADDSISVGKSPSYVPNGRRRGRRTTSEPSDRDEMEVDVDTKDDLPPIAVLEDS
ncbi:hypothetical protein ABKN59_003453 [Abortiporus biennis]